ncbi:hypothetical protein C0J52_13555 [Blattella germanica]|nr:hypothetical protein C0J52_13555 [Blattella germanica]
MKKETGKLILDPRISRRTYVVWYYDKTVQKLRERIGERNVFVSIDETTDSMDRYVANAIVGVLKAHTISTILILIFSFPNSLTGSYLRSGRPKSTPVLAATSKTNLSVSSSLVSSTADISTVPGRRSSPAAYSPNPLSSCPSPRARLYKHTRHLILSCCTPRMIYETSLHEEKVRVWCVVTASKTGGSIFFDSTVDTEVYKGIFNTFVEHLDDIELRELETGYCDTCSKIKQEQISTTKLQAFFSHYHCDIDQSGIGEHGLVYSTVMLFWSTLSASELDSQDSNSNTQY